MIATYLTPWLASALGGRSRFRRVLKIVGLGESMVEERIKPYYDAHRDEAPLTILATSGQTELHIAADGDESAARARRSRRRPRRCAARSGRSWRGWSEAPRRDARRSTA